LKVDFWCHVVDKTMKIVLYLSYKLISMAAIAGISTKKNIKGELTHITVDVRKHKEVIPMFNEIGLLPKSDFQKRCEEGVSIEEARKQSLKFIDELWNKKK
jgi:hypothetical protein